MKKQSFPCSCGQPAVMEKAGQTVCARCATYLKGREFPLRKGKENSTPVSWRRKNNVAYCIAFFLWFCGAVIVPIASCQELPEAPKPKHIEIITDTVLAGSAAFDWYTTSQLQQNPRAIERNSAWAIGTRPDNHKIILFGAAYTVSEMIVLHFTEHSKHKYVRWCGRAYATFAVEEHIRWGIHNSNL